MAKQQTTTSESITQSAQSQKTQQQSEQLSQRVLDMPLVQQIMSGLSGNMTPEEIQAFAENLLRPQLNAGLEAAQQEYDAAQLTGKQQIEDLAQSLATSIREQQNAYRQSMANVETAALARGMGRSSYTLQALAGQGDALAQAVRELTDENARKSAQISEQMALAGQQSAKTQGRLNTDYAAQLAAKVQELTQQQRQEYNQNYMTAISSALGQRTTGTTTGTTDTTGRDQTNATQTVITQDISGDAAKAATGGSGSSGGSGTTVKKTTTTATPGMFTFYA